MFLFLKKNRSSAYTHFKIPGTFEEGNRVGLGLGTAVEFGGLSQLAPRTPGEVLKAGMMCSDSCLGA
jgi:hypothetical protein